MRHFSILQLGFFIIIQIPLISNFPYGPHTALDCLGCHDPHYAKAQKIFKVKNELMVNPRTGQKIDDVSALCLGCHNTPAFGGAGVRPIHLHMTHPVNVVPYTRIANVPGKLLRKDMIQCVSCHDPHPSNPNWRYLRVDTESGTKVGRFCETCHPAKADTAYYNVTQKELGLFTSMNEKAGPGTYSPWDESFFASNPTPVYIQPYGEFPNSIGPAYPVVANLDWIYSPDESRIPEELRRSIKGEELEPNQDQEKQQEFNQTGVVKESLNQKDPAARTTNNSSERKPDESSKNQETNSTRDRDPEQKEKPAESTGQSGTGSPSPSTGKQDTAEPNTKSEQKTTDFGLSEGSLQNLGSSGYLSTMFDGVRSDFEGTGIQLIPVKDGYKGKGVLIKKDKVTGPDQSEQIRSLVFRIDGNLAFETGSAKLTPLALELVDRVGRAMKAYPETTAGIVGHTDSTGSRALNDRLSLARAKSVADRLQKTSGIPKERFTEIKGMADRQKIVDTSKAEPENRRVEITVTPVKRTIR